MTLPPLDHEDLQRLAESRSPERLLAGHPLARDQWIKTEHAIAEYTRCLGHLTASRDVRGIERLAQHLEGLRGAFYDALVIQAGLWPLVLREAERCDPMVVKERANG